MALLEQTCGRENIATDTYTRVARSYGHGMIDAIRLRKKIVENLPDVVVAPRTEAEIEVIVRYANEHRLPIYVYGGGSSVTRGMEATRGGITLDLSRHMNRLVELNEINHTVTVEAGMSGPQLEDLLQHAVEKLGAKRPYTCGHFPQSFEYSSVGGWIVTRGAGQNSTYYGKIEDMVLSQRYITPRGIFQTCPQPRAATGPDFDQVMMGGEGSFGILTQATLRICHWQPENRVRFSYMFKSWEGAGGQPGGDAGRIWLPIGLQNIRPRRDRCDDEALSHRGHPGGHAAESHGLPANAKMPDVGIYRWGKAILS